MEKSKLRLIKNLLDEAENNIEAAKQLTSELGGLKIKTEKSVREKAQYLKEIEKNKIIEGVFDGENMTGPDGNLYPVQPNYASKSKLVPGDILKLTIDEEGSFIFKQIKPVERKNIKGKLTQENGEYRVVAEGRIYKVLLASVTYFKANANDKVTLVVPAKEESSWGAIENIIKEDKEQ